jgi:hypothetical protein
MIGYVAWQYKDSDDELSGDTYCQGQAEANLGLIPRTR